MLFLVRNESTSRRHLLYGRLEQVAQVPPRLFAKDVRMARKNQPMKRKPGRPPSPKGKRPHVVKVSLHADELQALMDVTNAPAQYLREAGLDKAKLSNDTNT